LRGSAHARRRRLMRRRTCSTAGLSVPPPKSLRELMGRGDSDRFNGQHARVPSLPCQVDAAAVSSGWPRAQ
jgi:hypothetical protein